VVVVVVRGEGGGGWKEEEEAAEVGEWKEGREGRTRKGVLLIAGREGALLSGVLAAAFAARAELAFVWPAIFWGVLVGASTGFSRLSARRKSRKESSSPESDIKSVCF